MAIVGGIAIATNVNPPFTPFSTAAADFLAQPFGSILLALFGLEVVRQLHYLLSERWSGYHRFWSHGVFGGVERSAERFKPWTRFRIGRFFRRIFLILLLAVLVDLLVPTVSSPIDAIVQAPQLLVQALPFVIQIIVVLTITIGQFVALFWFLSRGGMDVVLPEEIKTRFKDVWGQDHVLDLIRENISFLERPDEIEAKGGYIPGGILLWGPPGTGKTLLAEAMAGETGKPYVFVEPGAFINMFLGVGILKVKGLYRRLRKLSLRHGGVIVFFDEADALGSRGALAGPAGGPFGQFSAEAVRACNGVHYSHPSVIGLLDQATTAPESTRADEEHHRRFPKIVMGGMGGGGMGTLQALLTEMNGLTKPRGLGNRLRKMLGMRPKLPPKYRILHVMATNMPNALDEAMLRPGRIDRIFKMGYPSKEGRRVTLNGYLAKVSHNLSEDQVEELATVTPYYTGAKIKDLVNEALILAIRDGRDTIEWDDIWRAKSLKELGPPEDAEYIERERHAVAVHEACHAVIAHLMLNHKKIDLATIERRGAVGGMVKPISMEDRFTLWKSEYEAEVMTFLASLAGERMFFEADNSAGVSSDLRAATQIVASMEGVYGMGEGITSWLGLPQNSAWQTPDPTEKVVGRMADRVEKRLKELYDRTWDLLDQHRDEVLTIAHALEQRKTISGDDIAEIMGSDPGSQVSREPKGWNVIDVEMATRRKVEALSRTSGERGEADDDDSPPNGHHPEAD
jgi:ATP-dependent Zn protease